jgi:hypothetical protein
MSTANRVVEYHLDRANAQWKWLRFLQYSANVAACATLGFLALGLAIVLGWIGRPGPAIVFAVLIGLGAFFAWLIVSLVVVVTYPDRRSVAGAIERVRPNLLDRLNTLIYLRQSGKESGLSAFAERIGHQARDVLAASPLSHPFSPNRTLLHVAAFLGILLATIWFYGRFHPLSRLQAAAPQPNPTTPPQETILEIPPPEEDVTETAAEWGEVRIVEPGRDLRITRIEAVPLEIEVGSSQPIESVEWVTAVNGAKEQVRPLGKPPDPKFAVFQPTIKPEELRLEDWDVVTYFARAHTVTGKTFNSDVYFAEVFPFREELEQLPSGDCKGLINELSVMIERQQGVIRETYRQQISPPRDPKEREGRRAELAKHESELGDAARHFAAKLESQFGPGVTSGLKQHLQRAESSLRSANSSLRTEALESAQEHERQALAELVAARKFFNEYLRKHPDEFADRDKPLPRQEAKDALKEIREYRDEARAADEFVKTLSKRQQALAQQTTPQNRPRFNQLAKEQDQLREQFSDFQRQHPKPFSDAGQECKACQTAMQQSANDLRSNQQNASRSANAAAQSIERLAAALERRVREQQLADAYKLRQMLDDKIGEFAQVEKQPNSVTPEQFRQSVEETRELANRLKQVAEQPPTRDDFGPKLREALNEHNQKQLDGLCNKACRAGDAGTVGGRQQAARALQQNLAQLAQAFDASQPPMLAQLQKSDRFSETGEQRLTRGMRQLEALTQAGQHGRRLSQNEQAALQQEALANIEAGLGWTFGSDKRIPQVMERLRKQLKEPADPMNREVVSRLLKEIQALRQELARQDGPEAQKESDLTHVDVSRLPPTYRAPVQNYFRKLSEQR